MSNLDQAATTIEHDEAALRSGLMKNNMDDAGKAYQSLLKDCYTVNNGPDGSPSPTDVLNRVKADDANEGLPTLLIADFAGLGLDAKTQALGLKEAMGGPDAYGQKIAADAKNVEHGNITDSGLSQVSTDLARAYQSGGQDGTMQLVDAINAQIKTDGGNRKLNLTGISTSMGEDDTPGNSLGDFAIADSQNNVIASSQIIAPAIDSH